MLMRKSTKYNNFDYSKLRGLIVEKYSRYNSPIERFAMDVGVSRVTISKKLNNQSRMNSDDVIDFSNVLKITPSKIYQYFFTQNVDTMRTHKDKNTKQPR
ncbi:hypothetical protein AO466_08400 [Oenococcus oeni]|nr:hypothetical protein AO466_08400 [Oenococcus oeni]